MECFEFGAKSQLCQQRTITSFRTYIHIHDPVKFVKFTSCGEVCKTLELGTALESVIES